MAQEHKHCKFCGSTGTGKYCNSCGQPFEVKRLTVKGILHEAFHFFTHFDKGFPYTIKKLITDPGGMQRDYVLGDRSRHQKPFSMFFLCATFSALALYLINNAIVKYFNSGDIGEVAFFHEHWVILQVCMLPVYSLIIYPIFKSNEFNYAEIVVLQLYAFSFFFVLLVFIHLTKFISPHFQTRYLELPLVVIYSTITNLNFFKNQRKWVVIIKSLVSIFICYFIAAYVQDLLVKLSS